MHAMSKSLIALLFAPLAAWAAGGHSSEDVKKDIERHRAMAAAHAAAAKCLEAGQPAEQCQKALLAACKGLAIGKYCGMKHQH
jgi:hypothetical protein